MQETYFEMIGIKDDLFDQTESDIRKRLNKTGFLDPSIIIETDNTVSVERTSNTYTIKSNLVLEFYEGEVELDNTIILPKTIYGVQEILVDVEDEDEPAYAEIYGFTYSDKTIYFSDDEDDHALKKCIVKYLTTKD